MLENSPKYLRDRFFQLQNYVWFELFPKDNYLKKLNNCFTKKEKQAFKQNAKEIVNEATSIMLIFVMKKFFADGTKIAQEAVDIFKKLDIDSFTLGGIEYKDRNENVMQGKILSDRLYSNLSKEIKELIKGKEHPHEIISLYKGLIDKL